MSRHPISAREARQRLEQGNARFASNLRSVQALTSQAHQAHLVSGQSPFAIVLSCSDSRVPSELVFDCGLGDLFVVRVAGNIVAPSLIGSVEFAASVFGTELVVVMGHTGCGAVSATLETLDHKHEPASTNIRDIVERIAPAVCDIGMGEGRLNRAVRANVRASVSQLRHGSRILEQRVIDGTLEVVGAEYNLETGRVAFLE